MRHSETNETRAELDRTAEFHRERRSAIADIAPLPETMHQDEVAACRLDLKRFLREFMPEKFWRDFDPDMVHALDRIEDGILRHGTFAEAMPRGKGKTTVAEGAMLWAASYGHRRFLVVIASDQAKANDTIANLQAVVEGQCPRYCEAFPAIAYPVAKLEGRNQRAQAQHIGGVPTAMTWKADQLVFPTAGDSPSNGVVIQAKGITARGLRGLNHLGARPDFVLLDDPQDDESARSAQQTDKRERTILGAVLGLAGHDKKISAVMPCTVISPGDLSDRFLDRDRQPAWQGYRTKLVETWPGAEELWKRYAEIWRADIAEGRGTDAATAFYAENRAAMDAGAVVTSPQLYDSECEISALQHAVNLRLEVGEDQFDAEYQNEPKLFTSTAYNLTPALVASRTADRSLLEMPEWGKVVVIATDINQYGLHSAALAFGNDQTAGVLWYGRLDNGGRGLARKNAPDLIVKQGVFAALVQHGEAIANTRIVPRVWLIDGGWQGDVVRRYLREQAGKLPFAVGVCRGYGGDRYRPTGRNVVGAPREACHLTDWPTVGRGIAFNAHYWCEVAQRAWLGSVGSPGSLSLFRATSGYPHSEFADHVCGETLVEKVQGQTGPMWKYQVHGRHDWGDAVYMCYVGAAWEGIGTQGEEHRPVPRRGRRVRHVKI